MRISASPVGVGETLAHDEMCLEVFKRARSIYAAVFDEGVWDLGLISAELEAQVGRGWCDVLIRYDGAPAIAVEVKSEKDQQHPSAWCRQVKLYANEAAPAVPILVVGHDLTRLQGEYIFACKIKVLDIRTMLFVVDESCYFAKDEAEALVDRIITLLRAHPTGLSRETLYDLVVGKTEVKRQVVAQLLVSGIAVEFSQPRPGLRSAVFIMLNPAKGE